MAKLRLTLACWDYDRTRALADGSVRAEGIDLNCLNLHVEETFFRMLRNREFDVAEMSLSSYAMSIARDQPAFIAIPVFPSRFFRQSCIFVSSKSGIREPRDLIGKRIGTPEYQMTAPVWIRGILQDEYGVDPASVEYFTGGEEEPGRDEKLKLELPPKFKLTRIGAAQTLTQMIADGDIDARTAALPPFQQDLVGDAEHGRRSTNAQREDQNRQQRGAPILAQHPQTEAKVLNQVLNPTHSPPLAARFLDRLHPPELSQRRVTRLLRVHPRVEVLLRHALQNDLLTREPVLKQVRQIKSLAAVHALERRFPIDKAGVRTNVAE